MYVFIFVTKEEFNFRKNYRKICIFQKDSIENVQFEKRINLVNFLCSFSFLCFYFLFKFMIS